MFDIYFINVIIAYGKYYNDINQYNRYRCEMAIQDNRLDIVKGLFERYKIFQANIINDCILYFHMVRLYFI
jgi:hypothetical protein